jgi:Outer membrane protein beta-barrel domain
MIKITTVLFAILFALQANAQIKKGSILLGGQIAANSNESKEVSPGFPTPISQTRTQKSSLVGLNIGTAIKENKIIGLNFNSSVIKENSEFSPNSTSSNKVNQFEIGLFYRQYKKISKDFYFFGQGDIAAISGKGTGTNSSSAVIQSSKFSGGELTVSAGVSYAVLKKLQIEISLPNLLSLQFSNSSSTSGTANPTTREGKAFSFNSSLTNANVLGNLNLGFRLTL